MSNPDETLDKVFVDLPNHWGTGGESIWAIRLDDGTFQIDNIPFYAYGLNYKDIVKVDISDPTFNPKVIEVILPSGHETIRVIFSKGLSKRKQKPIIQELESTGVSTERALENYVALDIAPEVDYDLVRNKLDEFERTGILEYETCESRVEGRFDEGPQEGEIVVNEHEN